jgi:hypothetical protein
VLDVEDEEQSTGDPDWIVIEDTDDPYLELKETSASSRLAKELIGKKVGDTFVLAPGMIDREGVIRQIVPKYVRSYNDCGDRWPISISSAEQLEHGDTPLQLAVVIIDTSKGMSAIELIAQFREELEETPGAAAEFDLRLAEVGYTDRAENSQLQFTVQSIRYCPVTETFPRIGTSGLPAGISRVTYELDLLNAERFGANISMQLDEYRNEFLEDIRARASVAANFTHNEFVDVCAELLGEAEELSDFESCYFRGSGSRNRSLAVDGFAQDADVPG